MSKAGKMVVWFALGALLFLFLSACTLNTPTPSSTAVVSKAPVATANCSTSTTPFTTGEFKVAPLGPGGVCLQPKGAAWQETQVWSQADWEYGVGAYLGNGATVRLPKEEGRIIMNTGSTIRLPKAGGSPLHMLGGKITVLWYSTASKMLAIIAGGSTIDPEYAVFELSYDPETEVVDVAVYAGEITVDNDLLAGPLLIPAGERVVFRSSVLESREEAGDLSPAVEELLSEAAASVGGFALLPVGDAETAPFLVSLAPYAAALLAAGVGLWAARRRRG